MRACALAVYGAFLPLDDGVRWRYTNPFRANQVQVHADADT